MDTAAEIKKVLKEFLGANPNLPITVTVMSVQGDSCTVKLLSGLDLPDVRLKATVNEDEDSLLIVPKIGSEVIVMSQTGELSSLMVIKVDAVEKIVYKKADFEFVVDGTTKKVTIKNGTANLGVLMNNLIDAISTAQIICPNGPGTINLTTVEQLNQIKTMFNLILNIN